MDQASLPVTQEIVGSNPIEVAWKNGAVRKSAKRRSSNLRDCGFDSRPRHFGLYHATIAALVSPTGRKPAISLRICRFNSFSSH